MGREIAEQSQQSNTTITQTSTQTTTTSQDSFITLHISTSSTFGNPATLTIYQWDSNLDLENEATELCHKQARLAEEPLNHHRNDNKYKADTTTEHNPEHLLPPPPSENNQGAPRTADNLLAEVYGMTCNNNDGLDDNAGIQDDQVWQKR